MAIEYTIKIDTVRVTQSGSLQDVVKEVNYHITGVDGDASFSLPLVKRLENPDPTSFVPFELLTEAMLVAWIEADEEALAPTKAHIAQVVAKEAARIALTEKPLPWAPPPAPAPSPIAE